VISPAIDRLLRENRHFSSTSSNLAGAIRTSLTAGAGSAAGAAGAGGRRGEGRRDPVRPDCGDDTCLGEDTVRETFEAIARASARPRCDPDRRRIAEIDGTARGLWAAYARLDLRQHSSQHESAVAEVLERDDYPRLAEPEKIAVLGAALASARRSRPHRSRDSPRPPGMW